MIHRSWPLLIALAISAPSAVLAQSKDVRDLLEKGDAAKALELARKASSGENAGLDAQRSAYIAAVAAGDAQLAEECLKKLADKAEADEKSKISRRRQWIVSVGKEAPDVTIDGDDNSTIKVATRGDRILILDFWNVLAAPSKEHVAALKKLHVELKENANVEFVGVNADAESRVEKAKAQAKSSGFDWPQCYEKTATKAPITNEAFKAGNPPWTVLIDSYGNIRAVGAADEPAFRYAVKAAIAEARSDFEPIMPRTRDGTQAAKPGSRGELAKAAEKAAAEKPTKKPEAAREPPSNQDAKAILVQAHTMRRGGNKTKARELYQKIVSEFPGTKEAQEAAEWLE